MRTKLLVVLVAALALSALLMAGGASAQRQGNDNASGGAKSKRVVGVRSSDTGSGSRVTITADDTLKDYSAYRSGDRFYVVLPKAAAGARGGGSGRGYTDMQVQQRGDSVVLSYRVQPGAKPRVEQKFNRLDVVFDVPGDAAQQAAAANSNQRQQQQQQQQTPPAENRNPPAQQNNQTQAAANPNLAPERRQPTAEEAARAQAANSAAANATQPGVPAGQTPAGVEPAAQNPAEVAPTQEQPAATPTAEPEIAQAQQPAPIAPITTTSQPATASQNGTTLGTFVIRNWAIIFAVLIVFGLGLIFFTRRKASDLPAEGKDEVATAKLEEVRTTRAKESTAKALKDASVAAQASTLATPKPATVKTPEPVSADETVGKTEASSADLKPLVGAAALAGGAAVAKSRKQSRKEARLEAKRKKKGAHAEEPAGVQESAAETAVAAPVAEETVVAEPSVAEPVIEEPSVTSVEEPVVTSVEEAAVASTVAEEAAAAEPFVEEVHAEEEPFVETPAVAETALAEASAVDESVLVETPAAEDVAQEAPAEVTEPVTAFEAFKPEQVEVAEPSLEAAAPVSEALEVETTEVVPFVAEAALPFVAEAEGPAPVTEIEPATAPEPERVLDETRNLLEGETYDRAVVGSRDAMARQMVAAELLSALSGRNQLKRERASAAFVEHGYFEETARDLREADAPAERSAAARSLAILGDRRATPLLVSALEDPVTDVRRAAVEALGALRDSSAIGPLEALLEREKNERNRIPPRVIRTAVEFCREGYAQAPPAAPADVREEETATVEVAPVEETAVETAPEPSAETHAPEVAEETSVSIAPFVDESAGAELFVAPEAETAAEATGEPAHVPEPVQTEETVETIAETGVEPFAELEQPFVETEEAAVETREEVVSGSTEETAIEPAAVQDEEVSTAGTFDFVTQESAPGQAALFDAGAEEATREIEPVAADSSKELTPTAGEWFDFDISEMGGEGQPTASATPEPEPSAPEPVFFESSAGEAFTSAHDSQVAEPAAEAAPVFETHAEVETHAEAVRDIEVTGEVAEPTHVTPEPAPSSFTYEPAAEAREKGLAPFDETSTVPASIQQRIASNDASERAAAIIELSHVDTDEAFQQICAAFEDPSQEVRGAAARALYELRADRAESFTRALREATPERRREIGAAISSSGLAGESISQLTGESRERTYEAFSLLFLMAKAGEVQPLLRAIEAHPNNEVRLAVVKLLALSGQKEVLPAFRRLAVRGSLPTEVRSAVMEAIYQISSSQPTPA